MADLMADYCTPKQLRDDALAKYLAERGNIDDAAARFLLGYLIEAYRSIYRELEFERSRNRSTSA